MDEEKKNIIQLMLGFVRRANGDHVSAYAAQAAYFLIMSFIPFILFLTTLIRYTPLSYNVVRDAIIGFVPGNLQTFVLSIGRSIQKKYSHRAVVCADGALGVRKGNAGDHQWFKYHLSCKGNPKLADDQNLTIYIHDGAVHNVVFVVENTESYYLSDQPVYIF